MSTNDLDDKEAIVPLPNGKYHDDEDDDAMDSSDVIRELRGVKRVQRHHSDALASIGAAVIRIEARLTQTEAVATRASGTNEAMTKLVIAEKEDEIAARRERRNALLGVLSKAAAFVFSMAGAGIIVGALLKGCNIAGAEEPHPEPTPSVEPEGLDVPS